ncbi:hypothetical protein Rfer_4456 (plasmid) [Rhodoferax ferrireducens T118]|uniref:Uncharacterized protein n=1 Tax=Albidiferax ferrireducens (strain ATCC BAA-621 / DSM 15236 / T118) TaxID=338969 RepID=Q21Q03_ALBFT|nr:hypothetical protein [Rhodoferax ferrireducens]ABD72142.1 hypothetical protein Rfer_4456 [Rhodoferax ferrireducens T118]
MNLTKKQVLAVQKVGLAVLEAIQAAGELGAPSGALYAALQHQGCTLTQYQSLTGSMERRGFVIQESDCFTITTTGEHFISQLRRTVAMEDPVEA